MRIKTLELIHRLLINEEVESKAAYKLASNDEDANDEYIDNCRERHLAAFDALREFERNEW